MKDLLLLLEKAKWLIGGNFIFAFSQWVILILLARLTTQEYLGQYALALAIVTPVFAVSNLQLRPLYILDVNSSKQYNYSNFYYLRIISSIFALFCCVILGFFSNVFLSVLILVALLKFFESYSDIIYAYYNAHNRTELISKSLFCKGLLSVVVVAICLYFYNFYIALFLFLIVYFLVWFFLDNFFILKTKEIIKIEFNNKILDSAIPMGISLGIVTLQSNIPRLFLDKYTGIEAVGLFTVLSYFIIVGSIFINSICQYLSPKLTVAWNKDKNNFKKLLFMVLIIAGFLGASAIFLSYFFGDLILDLIYGKSYAIYKNELILIMFAGFFLYLATVLGYTLTAIGFIKKQVYLFSILLIVMLLLSYFYIPTYGLLGAIYSLILGYIVQCLISFFVIYFYLKDK